MKKETPTPPLGWNSYDSLCGYADEQDLLRNLEIFIHRLAHHGYRYFVTDVGWYGEYAVPEGKRFPVESHASGVCLDGFGRYIPAPGPFPDGFRNIVAKAHAAGVEFGVHLMRGIPRRAVAERLPILGAAPYTAADIADTSDVCFWCDYNYGVNMDHPAAQAYYDSVIELAAEWGIGFLKVDDIMHKPREIAAVVKAVAKSSRPMVLSLSPGFDVDAKNWPVFREANMVRISGDIWDERGEFDLALQHWDIMRPLWEPGVWLDLDMIPFGRLMLKRPADHFDEQQTLLAGRGTDRQDRFTPDQKRYFMSMRSLTASPLIHGGHLPETDEFSFSLLTHPDVLACNQNGIPGNRLVVSETHELWMTPHREIEGRGWFGIFNRQADAPLRISVPQSELQMQGDIVFRDIWGGGDFQLAVDGEIVVDLPPDGVLFAEFRRK